MFGTAGITDFSRERRMALSQAVDLHRSSYDDGADSTTVDRELIATAMAVFQFLVGPAFLILTIGPVTEQATGEPVPAPPNGGSTMQIRATQEFTATVAVADSRGNVIGDQPGTQDDIAWSLEGGTGVLDLAVSEDSRTATVTAAGPVGSDVLRAQLGELFVTLAVDVVPGEAALITVSTTEPTEQETGEPEVPEQP
jgi:hypothetical protein